jgi:hypothetical protein
VLREVYHEILALFGGLFKGIREILGVEGDYPRESIRGI